jgi:hypothetical protein
LPWFINSDRREGGTVPDRRRPPPEQEESVQQPSLVRALFRRLTPGGRAETRPRSAAGRRRAIRRSAFEELQHELNRSRRFEHPFFVVRIPCWSAGEERWNRSYELADVLGFLVRSVDRVWADGSDVYLLLPECGREKGMGMLARLSDPLAELLSERERAGISYAAFPDDGLTSGALLDALHGHSAHTRTGDPDVVENREVRSPPDVLSTSEIASVPLEERPMSPEPPGGGAQ